MAKKKAAAAVEPRIAAMFGPAGPRESRSRGYAAGYNGEPMRNRDDSDAWKAGWRAAVNATSPVAHGDLMYVLPAFS